MANYSATLETQLPREEAFAYLSDFSNTAEWDPGTVQAERLGEGPIGEGSEFRLVVAFLGRETALTYRVVEHEPPSVVSFRGENSTVLSLDRITIVTAGRGTRITYDARLTLRGPLKLADPLLALAFKRVGDRALAAMRETLARKQSEAGARLSVSERT